MNRAQINKRAALNNIMVKISILRQWSTQAKSFGKDEYYPLTIRQFNNWDMSQNSAETREMSAFIKRNANDTLRSYPDLRQEVVSLISLITLNTNKHISKSEKLTTLRQKICDLTAYIDTLEKYTAAQKNQLILMQEKHSAKISQLNNIIDELQKNRT